MLQVMEDVGRQSSSGQNCQSTQIESEQQVVIPVEDSSEKQHLDDFLREIYDENEKFSIQRLIFNAEYFGFVTSIIAQ